MQRSLNSTCITFLAGITHSNQKQGITTVSILIMTRKNMMMMMITKKAVIIVGICLIVDIRYLLSK